MGSNIGTSVTNTIVSLTQVKTHFLFSIVLVVPM